MTLEQALAALKPFHSEVPIEALAEVRRHWQDAEPVLLAEIDRRTSAPETEDHSARFLYALFLCAETRCTKAFERYIRILRLPNLLLDNLLGDVLCEDMPEMLARTCGGRTEILRTLIEDETVNEYARSAALRTLQELVARGDLNLAEMQEYSLELLAWRLERHPSHTWDAAVSMAEKLHVKKGLPLIEAAYQQGLANPGYQSFEQVKNGLNQSTEQFSLPIDRQSGSNFVTDHRISKFIRFWSPDITSSKSAPDELLREPRAARQQDVPRKVNKIGRNQPCPCGSGKKHKKCCLGREQFPPAVATSPETTPSASPDEWISAGYYYLEKLQSHQALTCWWAGWQAASTILPANIQDPEAKECDRLFPCCDFFVNWLQDYQYLVEKNLEFDIIAVQNGLQFCQQVLEQFTAMDTLLKFNFLETKTHLLLALGRTEEAFALPAQMIEEQPCRAQGYVIAAELLSLDAQRFNLRPDLERARQLLLQARQNAADCEDWDVEVRLEDLNHLIQREGEARSELIS